MRTPRKFIPGTTVKSFKMQRTPSVSDILTTQLGKQDFGIECYNPKADVRDRIPPTVHAMGKEKRNYFTTQAAKDKMWVPDPVKYTKINNWEENPKFKYSKF